MAWLEGGQLTATKLGTTVNTVLFPKRFENYDGWMNVHQQEVTLDFEVNIGDFDSMTVYGFQVSSVSDTKVWSLASLPDSRHFFNRKQCPDSWQNTISACSGMGGGILGLHAQGFKCLGACEKSALACDSLRRNFDFPVIQASIGDTKALIGLHETKDGSNAWLEAGFPCQPFSRLGDRRGFSDDRANTFTHVLQCAWYLQLHGLVLECVPGAGTNTDIQAHLKDFCNAHNLQMTEVVLHLEKAWPCRRSRWWAILFPADWESFEVADLPHGHWQTVGALLPNWPIWPRAEEEQLRWTSTELLALKNPQYGPTDRRLVKSGKAPTLLHSIGNHFGPCPCGCRSSAFSDDRLRGSGIFVVEVITEHSEAFSRHLHPREAGLLLGVQDSYDYGDDLRGALGLLGQIASPLHSSWIGGHLREAIFQHLGRETKADLRALLASDLALIADSLFCGSSQVWPTKICLEGGSCTISTMNDSLEFAFNGGETVCDLKHAQSALDRDQSCWKIFREAYELPGAALLRPGHYFALETTRPQQTSAPALVEVKFMYGDLVHQQIGYKGTLPFPVCTQRCSRDYPALGILSGRRHLDQMGPGDLPKLCWHTSDTPPGQGCQDRQSTPDDP